MKTTRLLLLVSVAVGLTAAPSWAHPEHDGPPPRDGGPDLHALERPMKGPRRDTASGTFSNRVTIRSVGAHRVIEANGIPDHPAGAFPNRNNPNSIAPQNHSFHVPLRPQIASQPTPVGMQPFGVALNGVVFDPAAAEWWNGERHSMWQYEPMNMQGRLGADESNAHVQPTGAYHYHSVPTGLIAKLSQGKDAMTLIGWAADGFPIYGPTGYKKVTDTNSAVTQIKSSYRVKSGTRPNSPGPGGTYDGTFVADYEFVSGLGDLDECNGRYGPTPEFPQGTYHYFITEDFPFIPRFYKGTADSSFSRKGPPPFRRPPPGDGGGQRAHGPRGLGDERHPDKMEKHFSQRPFDDSIDFAQPPPR